MIHTMVHTFFLSGIFPVSVSSSENKWHIFKSFLVFYFIVKYLKKKNTITSTVQRLIYKEKFILNTKNVEVS